MVMEPFDPEMYPETDTNGREVVLYRVTYTEKPSGAPAKSYPDTGEPIDLADVQAESDDRTDAQGRITTITKWTIWTPADIASQPDDKFEYLGRWLIVEAGTTPDGIGNITFKTTCVEVS